MLGIVDKAIDLIRVPENDVQAIIALTLVVMPLVMGRDAASSNGFTEGLKAIAQTQGPSDQLFAFRIELCLWMLHQGFPVLKNFGDGLRVDTRSHVSCDKKSTPSPGPLPFQFPFHFPFLFVSHP